MAMIQMSERELTRLRVLIDLADNRPVFVLVVCDGVSSSSSSDRAAAIAAAMARATLVDALQAGS